MHTDQEQPEKLETRPSNGTETGTASGAEGGLVSALGSAPGGVPGGANDSDHDDIEKIMNEIENLREGMKATVASKNGVPAASQQPEPALEPGIVPEPVSEDDDSGFLPESSSLAESAATPKSAPTEEDWLEETYANLKDAESAVAESASDSLSDSLQEEDEVPEGSLTLLVQGSMTVCLRHQKTGQEVGVAFEGDFIRVYLADGAELTIPVKMKRPTFGARSESSSSSKKRAA